MGELKQINIKKRTYYFYNNIINLDEIDESKVKVDKKTLMTFIPIVLATNIKRKFQNAMY